jgi:hypothetical protein
LRKREFEYTATDDGRLLEECSGDFPCSESERQIFLKSLRYFKIPNAAQYQEPSRFKTMYQHKRIRPLFVLLKAFELAPRLGFKSDLVTASVPIYANTESPTLISRLIKQVHSKFKRAETSKAPFRDANTLVSWGRQLGLLHGEGIYEITDEGNKFLQQLEQEKPIWWIDSAIQEFIALTVMDEAKRRDIELISFSQLAIEVEKIAKKLAVFKSKSEHGLSELSSISVENDKANLMISVSINIASDVPFEHQEKMVGLISDSLGRLSQVPTEIEVLRRRVKELEAEIAKQREQAARAVIVDMPQIDELPLLATFDSSVIRKYGGQTLVAAEFENRVNYVLQLLNYDVIELGHKTKEIAPDSILLNKYPSLSKTGPNEAIFIECKASKQPYTFSRHDIREIQDYVERWYEKCLKEYMAVPSTLFIVSGKFVSGVAKRSSELEKKLYNIALVFVEVEMLVKLAKQFMKNPSGFNQDIKANFFKRLVKDTHQRNAPIVDSKTVW